MASSYVVLQPSMAEEIWLLFKSYRICNRNWIWSRVTSGLFFNKEWKYKGIDSGSLWKC
jgi:hypothetical protein